MSGFELFWSAAAAVAVWAVARWAWPPRLGQEPQG